MDTDMYRVVVLNLRTADTRTLAALNEQQNQMQAERSPADPPLPLDVRLAGWRNMPAGSELRCWVAWRSDGQAIIANAWTEASTTAADYELVNFNCMVLPAYRQRGIGQRLLAAIAAYAHEQGRHMLMTQTRSHLPAGAIWMRRIGATPRLDSRTSQLMLAGLDMALLDTWIARAAERAPGYTLYFGTGPYPEDDLAAIARLHEVHNTGPGMSSILEETSVSPLQLRQHEAAMHAQGMVRWTAFVREQATGTLAGMTEVTWMAQYPEQVEQGITAVLPTYRNRGLGRWLKAAMLDKLLHEQPAAQVVRTGNAASNAPMLNINKALGFKPISEDVWWEMRLERVQDYLAVRGLGV